MKFKIGALVLGFGLSCFAVENNANENVNTREDVSWEVDDHFDDALPILNADPAGRGFRRCWNAAAIVRSGRGLLHSTRRMHRFSNRRGFHRIARLSRKLLNDTRRLVRQSRRGVRCGFLRTQFSAVTYSFKRLKRAVRNGGRWGHMGPVTVGPVRRHHTGGFHNVNEWTRPRGPLMQRMFDVKASYRELRFQVQKRRFARDWDDVN